MRRLAPLVVLPLLLTSCTDGDPAAGPTPTPSSTECAFGATYLPDRCVADGASPTSADFPSEVSKIPPVSLPVVKGRLGGASNTDDPSRRTATFRVTVPRGSRIGSDVICLGKGKVTVDTVPASKAFQSIACDADAEVPSELLAEDPDVLGAATAFTVTVTAEGPVRWEVAVFSTTAPLGESQN